MNRELTPQQQQLAQTLSSPNAPERIIIDAPPGTGVSTVLSHVAANVAGGGRSVVVLTRLRSSADMWRYRMSEAKLGQIDALRSTREAVLALDAELEHLSHDSPAVSVAMLQALTHGAGRRVANSMRPWMLIIDGLGADDEADDRLSEVLTRLVGRAHRVIYRAELPAAPQWLAGAQRIGFTTISVQQPMSAREILLARYQRSTLETGVYSDALRMLEARSPKALSSVSTRPALHQALLALATSPHLAPDDAGAADIWRLIDRLEGLDDDTRLARLSQLCSHYTAQQRVVVVVADRADELAYVERRLASEHEVRRFSDKEDPEGRMAVINEAMPGTVVLASRTSLKGFELPPWIQVWWSSPQRAVDVRMLVWRTRDSEAPSIALLGEPPLHPDIALRKSITALQEDLGRQVLSTGIAPADRFPTD